MIRKRKTDFLELIVSNKVSIGRGGESDWLGDTKVLFRTIRRQHDNEI